jgi:hypothetical protein
LAPEVRNNTTAVAMPEIAVRTSRNAQGHVGVGTLAEDVVRVAEDGVVEQRGRDREDEGSDVDPASATQPRGVLTFHLQD